MMSPSPLAITVSQIRRGASVSFEASLKQLEEQDQVTVRNDLKVFTLVKKEEDDDEITAVSDTGYVLVSTS